MPTEEVPMPLAEVCDRFTIARLKRERLPDEDRETMERKVRHYARGIDFDDETLAGMVERLQEINGRIWDAEAAIRAGQDEDLGLEEIGRRALRIRDLNRDRVAVKNEISRYAGDGMEDVKVNYAR